MSMSFDSGPFTCFFVKPHAMWYRQAITNLIQDQRALRLVRGKKCCLSKEQLGAVYSHIRGSSTKQSIWEEALRDLVGKPVFVGLIAGVCDEDPLVPLVNLKGRFTDPRKCSPGSIRNFFARHLLPRNLGDGISYYDNVLHCPDEKFVPGFGSVSERERDLSVLWPEIFV